MTKKELIETLNNFPDDYSVIINMPIEGTDPGGWYKVMKVLLHQSLNTIELIIEDD